MADIDVLTVGLNGTWSVSEFSQLLAEFQFLYQVAQLSYITVDQHQPFGVFGFSLHALRDYDYVRDDPYVADAAESQFIRNELNRTIRTYSDKDSDLNVKRIRFASPGIADLAGIGKIVEQIRIFGTDMFDRHLQSTERKLRVAALRQEVWAAKIQNAHAIANFEKNILDERSKTMLIREILKSDSFIEAKILQNKITGIDTADALDDM